MVTIWGESAGANSVGTQLIAYGGRDDHLFRGAISESGAPSTYDRYQTPADWQPYYDAVVEAAGCSSAADSLGCLRGVPVNTLYDIFNNASIVPVHTLSGLSGPQFVQVIDGDFIQESATVQLQQGKFAKVPYLIGGNADEGTSFAVPGINTTEQFKEVISNWGLDNATTDTLAALYPDIPEIGIPATMTGAPPAGYGAMYKRVAAFQGDVNIHAARRLASQIWRQYNVPAYSYLFDVINNGPDVGANHGSEIPYVFNDVNGVGYDDSHNPLLGKPTSYTQLSVIMSRMWVSFVTTLDPNLPYEGSRWPMYELDNPEIIVFDVNVTSLSYVMPDLYRAQGIKYIGDNLASLFGH